MAQVFDLVIDWRCKKKLPSRTRGWEQHREKKRQKEMGTEEGSEVDREHAFRMRQGNVEKRKE